MNTFAMDYIINANYRLDQTIFLQPWINNWELDTAIYIFEFLQFNVIIPMNKNEFYVNFLVFLKSSGK